MSPNASFILPNVPPPDMPWVRVVALAFSFLMSGVMLLFIGFICLDFLAEIVGSPPVNVKIEQSPHYFPVQKVPKIVEESNPLKLISPKHQTQLLGPEVVVIYRYRSQDCPATPPDLAVDGIQYTWEMQYGEDTWFARLKLESGFHRLKAAESVADFFLATPDNLLLPLPEDWKWYHLHPAVDKTDRCSDCHEMTGFPGNPALSRTIGAWKGATSCFDCHDQSIHEYTHREYQPVNQRCVRCHLMH
jgi:hypothetical protein